MKEQREHLGTHKKRFEDEVFPAELTELRRRRQNAGDDRPLPGDIETPAPGTGLGLVGLAFSGGGIRSASFCLGVVQHLLRRRLFPRVDYLSTVSGGGFIGSCISSLMARDPEGARLLVDRDGAANQPAQTRGGMGMTARSSASTTSGCRAAASAAKTPGSG